MPKQAGICLLLLFMCMAFAGTAPRNDQWVVIGPGGGGSQYYPTVSPHNTNDVLAHCDMTGSYISHDGGSSWRMFNLRGRSRFYLFDPVDPNTIYVQTIALWRSADRGRTWNLVHPAPATVTGIRMMGDHASERILHTGAPRGTVTALAVDPADSKILYAAFLEDRVHGFYVSRDWGGSWEKTADLPGGGDKIFVDALSPKTDRTIYVVGRNSVAVRETGRWRSGGPLQGVRSFTETAAGFSGRGGRLTVYATSAEGGFVSEDGGAEWRKVSLPLTVPHSLSAVGTSLFHSDVAYLSYDNGRNAPRRIFGIARTTDRGRTWELVWNETRTNPPALREAWMWDRNGKGWSRNPENLGVAPTDPNLILGSDSMRTMRSKDGGKTWEAVYSVAAPGGYTTTGMDVTTCYGLHFDPFDPKRIVISYTDIGQFLSEDGGQTWNISIKGIPPEWRNTTYWMEFDPKVKGRVWGVMSYVHDLPRPKMWSNRSTSTYVGGLCRSDDGARSWKCDPNAIPNTAPTHILMDPESPVDRRVLYVAAFGKGVYKSIDGGDRWTLKNNGIEGSGPYAWRLARDRNGVLYLIVARRSDDGSIGNAFDGALYRSEDGAEHWVKLPLPKGVNGPNGLAIDPRDPKRLYLAAWGRSAPEGAVDGGIFLSTDGGASWRTVLDRDNHVYDVTIDPRDPKLVYASGFASSAWRSEDRGMTWKRIGGYNFKWGHRVVPDPFHPDKIYVTTFGGSVWYGPAKGDAKAPEDIATPVMRWGR